MMLAEDDVDIAKSPSPPPPVAPSTSDDESVEMERLAPVGESSDELSAVRFGERERFRELEEEQERLNNSLLSLSTHFAQVQFRLKQIGKADASERDKLLKELEDFAFRGCTDLRVDEPRRPSADGSEKDGAVGGGQRERQRALIARLKEQLEDLEKYAYESGEGELPSAEVIARQKAVIDKLREKVQLDLELDKMSQSDLQKKVDEALKKEKLVEQLQTQIVDLERFVSFLQTEISGRPPSSVASLPVAPTKKGLDARAQLELAVDATVQIMEKYLLLTVDTDSTHADSMSDSSDEVFERSEEEVVTVVRKELCPAIRNLLEHGMNDSVKPIVHFSSFGCYPGGARKIVGGNG
ncbi:unnamed protein product [Gongylonema pulchrum]|uniref:Fibrous sheath-interacting protein 1 n=1 Tax=Gongylonema pulchrum TaxID=637853 RepID=A0A183ED83_9BILA|nr:unnamed protein product [Gongylonema pulchrum]